MTRESIERAKREAVENARRALNASDDEVGPACMYVEVPPTIADDDTFREAYSQGYRHALSDARAALASHRSPSTGERS